MITAILLAAALHCETQQGDPTMKPEKLCWREGVVAMPDLASAIVTTDNAAVYALALHDCRKHAAGQRDMDWTLTVCAWREADLFVSREACEREGHRWDQGGKSMSLLGSYDTVDGWRCDTKTVRP